MKYYPQYALPILKKLMEFMGACQVVQRYEQELSLDQVKQSCQKRWEDWDIQILPPDNMSLDFDRDGIIGSPDIYEKILKVCSINLEGPPLGREEALKQMAQKWTLVNFLNTNLPKSIILFLPHTQCHANINSVRFVVGNTFIQHKAPSDQSTLEFLQEKENSYALSEFAEAVLGARKQVNGPITETDFLKFTRQEMIQFFSRTKRAPFIEMVEKTRQALFDILIDKNTHSPTPTPNLYQTLQQNKDQIFKLAAQKGLIHSAQRLIDYQEIRDGFKHPDQVALQPLPPDEEIIDTFDSVVNKLRGKKPQKTFALLHTGPLSDQQKQFLEKNALAFFDTEHKQFVDLAIADEQTDVVDTVNRHVAELVPEKDANGNKIKKKNQLDHLVTQQVLTQQQRIDLGQSITRRNHLSHGHSTNQDVIEMADPKNQQLLEENSITLFKKVIETRRSNIK